MKIKKLIFLLFSFTTLNGCIETTAFLGPAVSVGTTGNVYQASLSYASNQIIHSTTGKTTIEHVTSFLDPNDEFEGNLDFIVVDNINIVVDNINDVKEVLKKKQKNLLSIKSGKKSETILNSSLEDQFILF